MKAIILIITVVLSPLSLLAQIGIKTAYPKALFHIDAAGDNPTDGVTPLTEAQAFNDVVINSSGAFSVGTTQPLAKFHMFNIPTTTTPQPITLQFDDPNKPVGETNTLHTDNNQGIVKWAPTPEGVSYAYNIPSQSLAPTVITFLSLTDVSTNSTVTSIPITKTGRYLFTFTIAAQALPSAINTEASRGPTLSTYVYIYDSSIVTPTDVNAIDAIEYYLPVGTYNYTGASAPPQSLYSFTFTTTLFAGSLTAGQNIKIAVKPMIGVAGSWAFANNVSSLIIYNI